MPKNTWSTTDEIFFGIFYIKPNILITILGNVTYAYNLFFLFYNHMTLFFFFHSEKHGKFLGGCPIGATAAAAFNLSCFRPRGLFQEDYIKKYMSSIRMEFWHISLNKS